MKNCKKCNKNKEKSCFGKDSQKSDGLNTYCKECIKKRSKNQRILNPEYYKKYGEENREKNREQIRLSARKLYWENHTQRLEQNKNSYNKNKDEIAKKRAIKRRMSGVKEKDRERMREWRQKNKNKVIESITNWKRKNPEKSGAHSLVLWAVKTGVLTRSECCQQCGINCKTQGHHENYQNPLNVIWLCKKCHCEKHRIYR